MELLDLKDIARQRRPVPYRLGVIYFLFDNDELVYIGQTTSLEVRLNTHRRGKAIHFDSYNTLDVSELNRSERSKLEARYIRELQPRYNKACKSPAREERKSPSIPRVVTEKVKPLVIDTAILQSVCDNYWTEY